MWYFSDFLNTLYLHMRLVINLPATAKVYFDDFDDAWFYTPFYLVASEAGAFFSDSVVP